MGGREGAKVAVEGEIRPKPVRVPWKCGCGAKTSVLPFVVPKGWVLQRNEEGTGLVPTMKDEKVLCPDCVFRQRSATPF
jgi:hypothetical protein